MTAAAPLPALRLVDGPTDAPATMLLAHGADALMALRWPVLAQRVSGS